MRFLPASFVTVGLIVAAYLLMRSFEITESSAVHGGDVCSLVFRVSCDATLQSPLAHQAGIPLAGWGTVFYGTIAALLLTGWLLGEAFRREALLTALLFSIPAAGLCLLLAWTLFSGLVPFCPLCVVLQVNTLLLCVLLHVSAIKSPSGLLGPLGAAIRYALGGKSDDPTAPWKVLGVVASLMVGVILYQWIMIQENQRRFLADGIDLTATLAGYQKAEPIEIPVDTADPHLGPLDGPVRLVVFSDLKCPGCRRFAETMERLRAHFGDQLTIVFKHFPLEASCNRAINANLHPGACGAALAGEAAKHQEKFWELHHAVFHVGHHGHSHDGDAIVQEIGLDADRWQTDAASERVRAKVATDVDLGIKLGVDATPTVFLNGRRLRDLRFDPILFLITHESH
jgi:protein-disulfide isomerase/uncharacterized membrane protein